jgi:ribosome-binding protein aMBF1 (putative translation factor)
MYASNRIVFFVVGYWEGGHMADVVQRLGETLHLARRRREMTIKDLAVDTGVSPTIISLIETGKRPQVSFAVIAKLAKRLPVSLDALVAQDESDDPGTWEKAPMSPSSRGRHVGKNAGAPRRQRKAV